MNVFGKAEYNRILGEVRDDIVKSVLNGELFYEYDLETEDPLDMSSLNSLGRSVADEIYKLYPKMTIRFHSKNHRTRFDWTGLVGKPPWECSICYEDGTRTGEVNLACGHGLCLQCYTLLENSVSAGKCPCCRNSIYTGIEKPIQRELEGGQRVLRNIRFLVLLEIMTKIGTIFWMIVIIYAIRYAMLH
jgi:hypothetical protein